jgi:hypothetical protein
MERLLREPADKSPESLCDQAVPFHGHHRVTSLPDQERKWKNHIQQILKSVHENCNPDSVFST